MSPQVLGQALVRRVRLGREDQVRQLALQATAGYRQSVIADLAGRMTVTQVEAGPEQLGHATREADRPTGRRLLHRVGAPQEVVETLLVAGVLELVVRRPAVVDHGAVVVRSHEGLGHGAAAGRVDDVSRRLRADQRMQPGGQAAYPPTGL